MTNPLFLFLGLLGVHWVGDFVCQTHWQASNKSKNWYALVEHIAVYTCILMFFTELTFHFIFHDNSRKFAVILIVWVLFNGFLHFWTDFFTSKWTSKLYQKQDWHNFFVVVGLDQLIHSLTLGLTLWYLFFHV